jgi:L-malate glycosyltransferase
MLGAVDGWVKNQSQIQGAKLAEDGYEVSFASSHPTRGRRVLDIATTLFRERRRADVVVFMIFGYRASFMLNDIESALARLLRLRSVAVVHSGDFPEFATRHPRWVRRVLRRATVLAAPSPFLVRELASLGFETIQIPNLVDLPPTNRTQRPGLRPRLLWMRKFHDLYNPEMAIRVLGRLRAAGIDATLTMAGQVVGIDSRTATTNTLLDRTQALCRELGLTDHVRFPGFLDNDAKARAFLEHDLYLNTNHVDNAPVGLLEAAASGLAIVTTDVGGIRDLMTDGVDAVLVPDDDDAAMADAVIGLLREPQAAARMCRAAGRTAEEFTWPRVRRAWEEAFALVRKRADASGQLRTATDADPPAPHGAG